MKLFVKHLQDSIQQRRENNYDGVYKETQNILHYMHKENFLRKAQKEAFEIYVYLKERLKNKPLYEIYPQTISNTKTLLQSTELTNEEVMEVAFLEEKERNKRISEILKELLGNDNYSNQVYALTMGTGKTVLMTMFILYDIVLSYYHKEDPLFAKNFLVFAPDKTIIQSLKEIKEFDYKNVIPSEYQTALLQIKYHYLEDTKHTIGVSEGSEYNIIVTNSQKIIVKTRKGTRWNHEKALFGDEKEKEKHEIENQRLLSIKKLSNLSVFIDEAHHSFWKNLEGGIKKTKDTINRIHENKALVNCINMTGTPYINGQMIPNVVYYYGLKEGIQDGILKQAEILEFWDVKDTEFLKFVIDSFWEKYGEKRITNKLPKIAIYTANIEELQEVRKILENQICKEYNIPTNKIIENHSKVSSEELEEFYNLDTPESTKQIILLVNKGTEGRNCKSLFATALYRKPPQIFTLQATTRCLRAVGTNETKASIFLSKQNYSILDKELKLNFDIDISDLTGIKPETQPIECKIEKRKTITVNKTIKTIEAVKKSDFKTFSIDWGKYKQREIYINIKELSKEGEEVTYQDKWIQQKGKENIINKQLTWYEALGYLHKYTHIDFETLQNVFSNKEKLEKKLSQDNNAIGFVVEELLKEYYQYKEKTTKVQEEMQLVKMEVDRFTFEASKEHIEKGLICYQEEDGNRLWFHLNPYNFDSRDELELFQHIRKALKENETIKDVYFTGWSTNPNDTDFYFQYTLYKDNERKVGKYFPDFLVEVENTKRETKYLVIEAKGSDKEGNYKEAKQRYNKGEKNIVDEVFAKEIWFMAFQKENKNFEYRIVFDGKLPSKKKETVDTILKL